jgi:hypothetical protein
MIQRKRPDLLLIAECVGTSFVQEAVRSGSGCEFAEAVLDLAQQT